MDTLELTIELNPIEPWSDIVIAELSELGFDSFVTTRTGIQAYADSGINVQEVIEQTSLKDNPDVKYELSQVVIKHQNWNAQWEKSFDPVHVDDKVSIIAPFHDQDDIQGMKVIIQPQMSFGTGHHQTTWLMSKILFDLPQLPNRILDMGTGTGVLAIICEKLGAKDILAVDIEDWSAENAILNAGLNDCSKIEVVCGDIDVVKQGDFGLIIANINKNILKAHMKHYSELLVQEGVLLLSGFFHSDVDEMTEFTRQFGLNLERFETREEWAVMQLTKTN